LSSICNSQCTLQAQKYPANIVANHFLKHQNMHCLQVGQGTTVQDKFLYLLQLRKGLQKSQKQTNLSCFEMQNKQRALKLFMQTTVLLSPFSISSHKPKSYYLTIINPTKKVVTQAECTFLHLLYRHLQPKINVSRHTQLCIGRVSSTA
jgi:hypothetical protein